MVLYHSVVKNSVRTRRERALHSRQTFYDLDYVSVIRHIGAKYTIKSSYTKNKKKTNVSNSLR